MNQAPDKDEVVQVHLSRFDQEVLRQQAIESIDLDDDGESFVEEALTRFSKDDLEVIEEMCDDDAETFLHGVFNAWNTGEQEDIVETLGSMLEDLDIELDYGGLDEESIEESEGWSDVESLDDDEEFEGY